MKSYIFDKIIKKLTNGIKFLHLFLITEEGLLYSLAISNGGIIYPNKKINLPKFSLKDKVILQEQALDNLVVNDNINSTTRDDLVSLFVSLDNIYDSDQIRSVYVLMAQESRRISYQDLEVLTFFVYLVEKIKSLKDSSLDMQLKAAKLLFNSISSLNTMSFLFDLLSPNMPLKTLFETCQDLVKTRFHIDTNFLSKKLEKEQSENFSYTRNNFYFYKEKPFTEEDKLLINIISSYLSLLIKYKKLDEKIRLLAFTYSQFFIETLALTMLSLEKKDYKHTCELMEVIFKIAKRLPYLVSFCQENASAWEEKTDIKELLCDIANYITPVISWCDVIVKPPIEHVEIKINKTMLFLFLSKLLLKRLFSISQGRLLIEAELILDKIRLSMTDTNTALSYMTEFANTNINKVLISLKNYIKKHSLSFEIKPNGLVIIFKYYNLKN